MISERPRLSPITTCRRSAHPLPGRCDGSRAFALALIASIALFSGCDRTASIQEIRALQASGQFEQSIDLLRQRIEEMPDDAETNYLYGAALSRSGAPRLALWSLRKAAEDPQWELIANLELADAQARAENWQAAIEAANAVLELEPESPEAHMIRGMAYLTEGKQIDLAIEDFDFILEADSTNFGALTSRASALILLGRVDEASEQIDAIEKLTSENPADTGSQAQICATQAVLLQERGDLDRAEERFEACLVKFPAFAIVVEPAMAFFDARGDRDRSTAILTKALELAPISLDYREALAERLEKAGDPERALAVLRDGLSLEDHQIRSALLTDITNHHVDRDQLTEAIAAYEELLSMVDDAPQLAILNHADLLARAGRHDEARRVAKGLEETFYADLIEARIALSEGDPKRALDSLDRVFPKWPNNAGARYYAARAAEQLGDFVRAIDEYRQSIRSGSDQTEAALRLAKLYLMAGANAEAWASATQYIMNHNYDPEGARVLIAAAGQDRNAPMKTLFSQFQGTPLWAAGLATRAEFLAEARSPKDALKWLEESAGPPSNWERPENAELIRTQLRLLARAGRGDEAQKRAAALMAAHPESAPILEIHAALLEDRAADPSVVAGAFEQAVAKDGKYWLALVGLARAREQAGDVRGAIELLDRATKAHPESPDAAARAARLACGLSDSGDCEKRWSDLIAEHPWSSEAARALVEIRLARKQTDARTLDLAERSVLFGGAKPEHSILVRVHEARGEHERAREISEAMKAGKPIPPRENGPKGSGAPAS